MTDSWRRLAAAGHLGDQRTAAAGLDDDDPVCRELALGALDRLGTLTAEQLRTALADSDPAVRRRAVLLAASRPDVPLRAMLDDADETVVEAAAFACGERERADDATLRRLVQLATGASEPLVREAAVAALGALGDERGVEAILRACADRPAIRRRAVLALAPFTGSAVDAALHAALEDRDWQVRQSAEDVLRAAGSPSGRDEP